MSNSHNLIDFHTAAGLQGGRGMHPHCRWLAALVLTVALATAQDREDLAGGNGKPLNPSLALQSGSKSHVGGELTSSPYGQGGLSEGKVEDGLVSSTKYAQKSLQTEFSGSSAAPTRQGSLAEGSEPGRQEGLNQATMASIFGASVGASSSGSLMQGVTERNLQGSGVSQGETVLSLSGSGRARRQDSSSFSEKKHDVQAASGRAQGTRQRQMMCV